MKEKYTAQATTTDEAIQKGLKALGIQKNHADIDIIQESKKGFLGIGQQDAVVVVTRKNAKNAVDELVSSEAILDKEPSTLTEDTDANETSTEKSEATVVDPVAEDPDKVKEAVEETEDEKTSKTPAAKTSQEATETRKTDEEENKKDQAAIQRVADYLERIAQHMGVEDISITVKQEDRRVYYTIDTKDAGLIIGRHGKVLDSLQTLAQVQLHQDADNKLYAKVDAENYRQRRRKTVEHLAKRTADKVKRTNRPVILEPMPAHERKQIHRYLNRYDGVQTHSEGKEPHRYLVVEPKEEDSFNL